MRETVHVLRNAQGGTEALVGFIFDIHERKQTEQRLLALQRELQALSYQDSLTRVANRRRFDEALAQVCDKCNDLVARYGGEEFVVLLPKVGLDIARQVAERFRRLLQEQAIPHARSPFGQQVTVSIGAGSLVPQPGQDCAGFVHAVDQLLYAAKNAGRNRVVAQAVLL